MNIQPKHILLKLLRKRGYRSLDLSRTKGIPAWKTQLALGFGYQTYTPSELKELITELYPSLDELEILRCLCDQYSGGKNE